MEAGGLKQQDTAVNEVSPPRTRLTLPRPATVALLYNGFDGGCRTREGSTWLVVVTADISSHNKVLPPCSWMLKPPYLHSDPALYWEPGACVTHTEVAHATFGMCISNWPPHGLMPGLYYMSSAQSIISTPTCKVALP